MPHGFESSQTEAHWCRSMNCNTRARPLPGVMTECSHWSRGIIKKSRFSSRINTSRWISRTSACARIKERGSCSTVISARAGRERRRRRGNSRLGRSSRRCIAHGCIITHRCHEACRCTRTFSFTDSRRSRNIPLRTVAFACRWRAPIRPSGSTTGSMPARRSALGGIGLPPPCVLKNPLLPAPLSRK